VRRFPWWWDKVARRETQRLNTAEAVLAVLVPQVVLVVAAIQVSLVALIQVLPLSSQVAEVEQPRTHIF
jgi:hypothetical protein